MSTSIRNRLAGTIEKIIPGSVVSELVIRTLAGDVKSIIRTGSVKRMNLKGGDKVFVLIKATNCPLRRNSVKHAYEIRPTKDKCGVDPISHVLPLGRRAPR